MSSEGLYQCHQKDYINVIRRIVSMSMLTFISLILILIDQTFCKRVCFNYLDSFLLIYLMADNFKVNQVS